MDYASGIVFPGNPMAESWKQTGVFTAISVWSFEVAPGNGKRGLPWILPLILIWEMRFV
jgi:hypothetical protein